MLTEIGYLLTPGEIVESSWKLNGTHIFATNKRLIIRGKVWREAHRNPVRALLTQDVAYEHIISIEHMVVKPNKGRALFLFIPFFWFMALWLLSKFFPILLMSLVFLGLGIYGLMSTVLRNEFIIIHTAADKFFIKSRDCKQTFKEVFRHVRSKNSGIRG